MHIAQALDLVCRYDSLRNPLTFLGGYLNPELISRSLAETGTATLCKRRLQAFNIHPREIAGHGQTCDLRHKAHDPCTTTDARREESVRDIVVSGGNDRYLII